MSTEKIDRLLADWKKKLDLIGQNLIDLDGMLTYQRLTGAAGFSKVELTGITAVRVTPALETLNDVFQHFDLLSLTVEQAIKLRSSLPRFLGSEKLEQIERILTGESIELSIHQIPIAKRGLLSAAQSTNLISPTELLTRMTDAFWTAKTEILAVETAWLHLETTLAAAENKIKSFQKLADSLNISCLNELSMIRQRIDCLRNRVQSDPLGVNLNREIEPLISQVQTTLKELVKQRHQLQDKFVTGRELLKQLVEVHTSATAAFKESQEKVVDCSNLQTPMAQEKIDALSQWLTRLEAHLAEGQLQSVTVGIENWTAKAKEYILIEEGAYTVNQAPVETRKELRGRLEALQAKAIARGLVEDPTLIELAEKAKALLYIKPTPLARAIELVYEYELRLNRRRE